MMIDKLVTFFSNWKTAVPGLLAALCATSEYFELLPDSWRLKATAICTFLVAMGLIAAKDADRSNAPRPEPVAQKVA